jgi:CRISPR-associated protein Cas6
MVRPASEIAVAEPPDATVEMVDLAFGLRGSVVARDYADALWQELRRCLPWLEGEAAAGVHPIGGVSEGEGQLYLSGRSRLILRLPQQRGDAAHALTGQRLSLGGGVEIGQATTRRLAPATTLYSSFVSCGPAEEAEFMLECRRELEASGFSSPHLVCGKARRAATGAGEYCGFSLMVHGLRAEDSLRLQRIGLGGQRKRGCGIFVGHKSVAAVEE